MELHNSQMTSPGVSRVSPRLDQKGCGYYISFLWLRSGCDVVVLEIVSSSSVGSSWCQVCHLWILNEENTIYIYDEEKTNLLPLGL